MKKIKLNDGQYTLVDNNDFKFLNQFNWIAQNTLDGKTRVILSKSGKTIYMHRMIMKVGNRFQVDHKNGNPLDNQKLNLRKCTISQNQMNQAKQKRKNKSSKFKGVSWDKFCKGWRVRVFKEKKCIYYERFKNEVEAAKNYDKQARKHFGIFANTNF